nr:MAG TPA: hypothetical protein [Caudoviricetes sp.]
MDNNFKRILEDKLEGLMSSNAISAEEVLSLESLVTDIDPTYGNFITKDIPIHKFTMRPSTTNLEPVKLKITSILSSFRDTETRINGNSARIFQNNLWSLEALFGSARGYVESIAKLDESVLSVLEAFKYTTEVNGTFIEHDIDTPLLKAVLDTNIKDIFFPNGIVPESILHPTEDVTNPTKDRVDNIFNVNGNDLLWGIFNYLIGLRVENSTVELKGDQLVCDFINRTNFALTRGHSLTIRNVLEIHEHSEFILQVLTDAVNLLRAAQEYFYSSDYLKVMWFTGDDQYSANPEICPVKDIILALKEHPTYIEAGLGSNLTFSIFK